MLPTSSWLAVRCHEIIHETVVRFVLGGACKAIYPIELRFSQRRVLHFGRKRMGNWIPKDAQANWWIDVACYVTPLLKISECVALGGLHVFHVIPNKVRDLT